MSPPAEAVERAIEREGAMRGLSIRSAIVTPSAAVTFASFTSSVIGPGLGASIAGAPWFAGPLVSLAMGSLWVALYPAVTRRIARADGRADVERIAAQRAAAERLGVPLEELQPATPTGPPRPKPR